MGTEIATTNKTEIEKLRPTRAARVKKVGEAIISGMTQLEMSREFGVCIDTIRSDVKWLKKNWIAEETDWVHDLKLRRKKQLSSDRHQAQQAWARSKKKNIIEPCQKCGAKGFIKGKGVCDNCDGEGRLIIEIDVPGDHNFLKVAMNAVESLAKLEGLYPKGDHTTNIQNNIEIPIVNPLANASNQEIIELKAQMQKIKDNKNKRVIEGEIV